MRVGRGWILLTLVVALGLTACGQTAHPPTSDNNGVYVQAGQLTYQLEISRELNQYSTEDAQYLTGLPAGTVEPAPDELWYGVFLWAKNQTKHPLSTSGNFDIVDTQGNRYYPIRIDPALNAYAWRVRTLQPSETEPSLNTTANQGPTQGALLLFRLNTSVYSNRPLTLEIRGANQQLLGTISLDL